MEIPESLRPILGRLKNVRHSHHDCWRATCLGCGADELRIFEWGSEVRCGSCGVNTLGLEHFLERFVGEGEAPAKTPEVGKCEYCGEPFEILPYTRRKKRFCSGKHQKAMERQRKKGLS